MLKRYELELIDMLTAILKIFYRYNNIDLCLLMLITKDKGFLSFAAADQFS